MTTARPADWTDRPTPRWARVGAVLVIAAAAIVGPMAVAVTAHDVAVRDGLLPAVTTAQTGPTRPFYVATAPLDVTQVQDVRTVGGTARFD